MQLFAIGCVALLTLTVLTSLIKKRHPNHQATRRRQAPRVYSSAAPATPLMPEEIDEGLEEYRLENDTFSEKFEENTDNDVQDKTAVSIDYVVLHVMMPRGQYFGGYALIQTLMALGLRCDKDKLFHRYAVDEARGEKLFSVATANKPGTFDFSDIQEFACPGVTLIMSLKSLSNPAQAFEDMLATAQDIAEELGAEVQTENRQPLTVTDLAALRAAIAKQHLATYHREALEV